MRIAQVATLSTPVRRERSGSVESLVWSLTRELTRLGHEVTVFACAGSEVPGKLVATLPGPYAEGGSPDDWQLCEWLNLCRAVAESARFDVLHSHAYLWGIPLQPLARAPMIHTLHVNPTRDGSLLCSPPDSAYVTALSRYQWSAFPEVRPAAIIPHGVDPEQFTFAPEPEDYVCYLGRFTPGKGPLEAIRTAKALGLRLLLAGPANDYFEQHVRPCLGPSIEFVGYVSGPERENLLRNARALLYPIREPEPFGLVMLESMMCGTPVAAIRLGAVPEVIDEGITGCVAESMDEFSGAVHAAIALDRRRVRQRAESRFTTERMARAYARLYQQILEGTIPDGRDRRAS
jgi:glycosyltransferase involved in cell wall biosynthesis